MEAAAASPAASAPERAIPAEPGEQLQPPPVRQVDRGLEGRAGLEQHRAQAVLVPGRAGHDVVALGGEGAGGLEGLAAARDPRQGVRHAQGGPRDHRGVALVGLGLAGEQARGAAGGEPGQVGDPEPRGAGAPHGEGPYVAELVDDDERAGGRGGEQRVESALPVADGGAGQHLPAAVDQAGPVGGLADVQAEHGRGSGRWRFHGGILPVVVRPDGLPLGTHITSRGACPALSYQPSWAARPAPAAPNGPSRGQGRSAVRGRPVGGPFWARLNRSPRRARADNFDCNGRS